MTVIRIKGDKAKYDVRNKDCIGLPCLKLHGASIRCRNELWRQAVGWIPPLLRSAGIRKLPATDTGIRQAARGGSTTQAMRYNNA